MKKCVLFGFAAAMTLASCTQNEVLETSSQMDMSFGTFVDKSTKTTGAQENLEWKGSTFGVFGYYTSDVEWTEETTVFDNVEVTRGEAEGSWTYEVIKKWVPKKNYRFFAYAPKTNSATVTADVNASTVIMTDFQVAGTADENKVIPYGPKKQIDLMVANRYDRDNRLAFNNGVIGLNFKHILTNVNLVFKSSSQYPVVLTKVQLNGVNTKGNAVTTTLPTTELNSLSTTWSDWSNSLSFAGALNTEGTPLESTNPKENATVNEPGAPFVSMANMLMIPQSFAKDALTLDIEYTVGGAGENGNATFVRNIKLTNGEDGVNEWVSGTKITYNITINTANGSTDQQYDIVFGSTTTDKWADGANGSGSAQ